MTQVGSDELADQQRLPGIRSKLALLVMVCLVPGCIAVAVLAYDFYVRQRALLEQNMVQTAHALALAIDREVAGSITALQTLATSPHLDTLDLAAFYQQARTVLEQQQADNILLSEPSGQELINLARPLGSALPYHGSPQQIERVKAEGKPIVSDLFVGAVLKRPVISIDVPVWKNGTLAYVITMGILPEHLGRVLTEQHLPDGWISAVFDTQGIIIARTHQPEKFIGQGGTPILVERMSRAREGLSENNTLEGIPVYGAFSHCRIVDWAVALGVPKSVLLGDLRDSMAVIVLVASVLTGAGLGLAWLVGGQIGRSVRSLITPALALGSGEAVTAPPSAIREIDDVARALVTASSLISSRTAERDQARQSEAETQRLLQSLIDANGELQRFAYIASHDLQEPLRTVTSFTQLLVRRIGDRLDSETEEYAGFIVASAMRMHDLINGLLTFARVSGQGPLMEPVSAATACRAALDNLRDSIDGSGAEVTVGDLPMVVAAEIQLMQVFQNLISNAIKFRRPGQVPRVAVGAEASSGYWTFSVADNGIGVEKSDQDIFQIFRRLHGTDAYPGTGVGLAVCKKIIQGYGGRIWMDPNPDGGSIFRFTLPTPVRLGE